MEWQIELKVRPNHLLQETHLTNKDKHWLWVRVVEKLPNKWAMKTRRTLALISHKAYFRSRWIRTDKEGHYILIKGTIHQKEIMILNIYMPNVSVLNHIQKISMDFKAQIESKTIIMGHCNTLLSTTGHPDKKQQRNLRLKWNHETNGLNMYLQSILSSSSKYTLFSAV
jgi:hypothetical protein